MRAVLTLARRAAPHAVAVVVPDARTGYSPAHFLERTREDVRDTQRIAGETVLRTFDVDRAGRWVQTMGQVLYGLLELGLCVLELRSPQDALGILRELGADMMTWGYAPPEGEEVSVSGRRWGVSRAGLAVWLDPVGASPAFLQQSRAANAHATFGAIARAQLRATRLIQTYLNAEGSPAPLHSVDVLVRDDASYMLTTNGLSVRPRPGFQGDEGRLEIFLETPAHGLPLAKVLNILAQMVFGASPERPVNLFDRLPFEEPMGDIAGFVLAPRADVTGFGWSIVTWCQAVPITPQELAQLRAGALTGRRIAAVLDTPDGRRALSSRWLGLLQG